MLSAKGVSEWQTVLDHIESETTQQQFATWFRNLSLEETTDKEVVLSVPSKFHRDWIMTYYREILLQSVAKSFGKEKEVRLVVETHQPTSATTTRATPPTTPTRDPDATLATTPAPTNRSVPPRTSLSSPAPVSTNGVQGQPLTDGLDFEKFVIGKNNQLAAAAGRSLLADQSSEFSMLLISGATGLGKTHLLQAICREASKSLPDDARVAYVRGENFVNDFLQALTESNSTAFRQDYRQLDFVCFDDLQVLSGKGHTQQEFAHTLTAWLDRGTKVVLAARCSPGETLEVDPQILAQLSSAFRVTLHQPDPQTRNDIICAKAKTRGVALPQDVATSLADLHTTNIRELEGLVTSVIATSNLTSTPISLATVRATIQHDSLTQRSVASPEKILTTVCRHFDVQQADIISGRRPQALSFARQMAMYLLRERTELSLSEIGAQLGGRDHTTILHGIRKIERIVDTDSRVRDHLTRLRSLLDR